MDKYEHRRLRLLELLETPPFNGRGAQAELAKRSGIDASYISRLLYPEGKKGRKRLAENTIEILEEKLGLLKGWFDMPVGTTLVVSKNQDPKPVDVCNYSVAYTNASNTTRALVDALLGVGDMSFLQNMSAADFVMLIKNSAPAKEDAKQKPKREKRA